MSKLNLSPRVAVTDLVMQRVLRDHAMQVNLLTEGKLSAIYNAMTSAPTSDTYAQGDFVRNSAPVEAGSAGSKYVVYGWMCTSGGTPGTWVPCRFLTGN